jgi:hypothetical protein
MRYSSLKLLYYISEATGLGDSSKSGGATPSTEELLKTKLGVNKLLDTKSGKPKTAPSGKKKIYPGVDPRVLGQPNKVGQVGAEAGQLTVDATLNMGKGIQGAGSAKVVGNAGRLTTDRAADLLNPLDSELIKAERNAQQEAVRSMSNVSNFYKNLGVTTIPLTPKNSLVDTIASLLKPKPTP